MCSCLISRNLLSGMKTCSEVFHYMNYIESKGACGVHNGSNSLAEGHVKVSTNVLFFTT